MKYFLLFLVVCCTSCKVQTPQTALPQSNIEDHQIFAVLYQQHAAEYRALCYQAFNIARTLLDKAIANKKQGDKKLAIITDIDDTVLDNSPELADRILKNQPYRHEHWLQWTSEARANALPGAVEFLNYADSLGIEIFYVSNRIEDEKEVTIKNMEHLRFPQLQSSHFLLKTHDLGSSDKEVRRQKVLLNHNVALLLGDNLGDFVLAKLPMTERNKLADDFRQTWGLKNIVLPNPCYGGWVDALHEYKNNMTSAQIDSLRRKNLIR